VIEALLLKLRLRDTVSDQEEQALRTCIDVVEAIPQRTTIVRRGELLHRSILLLDGLVCRSKDLRDGRRQITALHVPGDFLDLHGLTLKHLDHDVMSVAPSRVAYARHDRLVELTQTFPHLTRLLWLSTNLDAAMHREWELSLGQRLGAARAAHLFCELYERLRTVDLVDGHSYVFPIHQTELGECLGLTPVHTNRVLRDLRKMELVEFGRKFVVIRDMERLRTLADFDAAYLYLDNMPR
jgi:CRP-like cAMP-binding protein